MTRRFQMIRCAAGVASGLLLVMLSSVADAQIVRVGPFGGVSVRAPFVSVDTSPWGGTRVRAPFTSVNTGVYRGWGYGYYGHVYHHHHYAPRYVVPVPPPVTVYRPVVPVTVYEPVPVPVYQPPAYRSYSVPTAIGSADPRLLAEQLRAAAVRLERSLSSRRDDSDVWLNYLQPRQIINAIDQGADPEGLRGLLANYDGVVGNVQLVSIRSARGFSETRSLLRQHIARSAARPAVAEPQESVLRPATKPPESNLPRPRSPEPIPAEPVKPAAEGAEANDSDAGQEGELVKKRAPIPI